MANPHIHAESTAKRYGGDWTEYLPIHEFMDSHKSAFPDQRGRALTHSSWFVQTILPRVFGSTITNSNGRVLSVIQIGLDHIAEDYAGKFIPTAQDWLQEIEYKDWMNNGKGCPPSNAKIFNKRVKHVFPQIK